MALNIEKWEQELNGWGVKNFLSFCLGKHIRGNKLQEYL
jgi:hypothetical protein